MTTEQFFMHQEQVRNAPSAATIQSMLRQFQASAIDNPDERWIHYLIGHTLEELNYRQRQLDLPLTAHPL
jgi:hypothetical protein